MENLKVKEVVLKANKSNKAFTSSKPPRSRSSKVEIVDSSVTQVIMKMMKCLPVRLVMLLCS